MISDLGDFPALAARVVPSPSGRRGRLVAIGPRPGRRGSRGCCRPASCTARRRSGYRGADASQLGEPRGVGQEVEERRGLGRRNTAEARVNPARPGPGCSRRRVSGPGRLTASSAPSARRSAPGRGRRPSAEGRLGRRSTRRSRPSPNGSSPSTQSVSRSSTLAKSSSYVPVRLDRRGAGSPSVSSPWNSGPRRSPGRSRSGCDAPLDQFEPDRPPGALTVDAAESVRSPTQCGWNQAPSTRRGAGAVRGVRSVLYE